MGSHVYGPVASRRLGRSLGVDIVPLKFCSFNCVYCQLGATLHHTLTRQRFYDPDEITSELREKLAQPVEADHITFSGSGEPTLSSDLGLFIREVKRLTDIPVAVLTNGSLLGDAEVRKDLAAADLVVPSLDAARPETFKRVNRPVKGLTLDEVISGLRKFSHEFSGKIWLEVLLVAGMNDSGEDIAALMELIPTLRVDEVQLNTVFRPPASLSARPVSRERLEAIRGKLKPLVETEIVVPSVLPVRHAPEDVRPMLLELVARRPCSEEELALTVGMSVAELSEEIAPLVRQGLIEKTDFQGKIHYQGGRPPGQGNDGRTHPPDSMLLKTIGIVHDDDEGLKRVEVFPGFEQGLSGLEEGEQVLVLYWMHELSGDARRVLLAHPAGDSSRPKQGVFTLRSPMRPNPIGITRVRVVRRDGRFVTVEGLDAHDGSPVVDIKWAE